MSLNHYQLYLEQVLQFAETIVIKSEGSAKAINDRITQHYGPNAVNQMDKTSWKYYLNLAGKYHSTDNKIIITSLDTLQDIEFSADNLKLHTATAKAYQYGTRYYREIVSQFPDQETLILGVLYPIDIAIAIEAPDFSVIGFPSYFIESNEESLITGVNTWLANYKTRWFNSQYTFSDKLYLTSVLGIMYQMLVPLILTLRLQACKTREAHSFHVREYLASHGMLDVYLDQMTKKQALFFYRNINYIQRHAGKVDTFDWLIDNVLTDRDIPVSEISLAQDDSNQLITYEPITRFATKQINTSNSANNSSQSFYTLVELLNKEVNEAPGNKEYSSQNFYTIDEKLKMSKTNALKTKVLESRMIDYTDAGLYSIQDIALDMWCYMSNSRQYAAYISYIDKVTGSAISLPSNIAFLYYMYAFAKYNEIEIKNIPEFYVNKIAIDPIPSVDEVKQVVDKKYVSQEDILFIRSLQTPLETVISTTAFNDLVSRTHKSYKAQHMFSAQQDNMYKRALIKNVTLRHYKAERVEFPEMGKTFDSVLALYGLPYENLTKEDWGDIYQALYEQATGLPPEKYTG